MSFTLMPNILEADHPTYYPQLREIVLRIRNNPGKRQNPKGIFIKGQDPETQLYYRRIRKQLETLVGIDIASYLYLFLKPKIKMIDLVLTGSPNNGIQYWKIQSTRGCGQSHMEYLTQVPISKMVSRYNLYQYISYLVSAGYQYLASNQPDPPNRDQLLDWVANRDG